MVLCWRRHGRAGGRQIFGGIAQLGEHLPCKQGVRGSNPLTSTVARIRASAAGFDECAGRKACFSDEACGKDGEGIRRMPVMKRAKHVNRAEAPKAHARKSTSLVNCTLKTEYRTKTLTSVNQVTDEDIRGQNEGAILCFGKRKRTKFF